MIEIDTSRRRAIDTIKAINSLIQEFDGASIKPNTILISKPLLQDLTTHFPYLIIGSLFVYNNVTLNIIMTSKDLVGLSLSFNTDIEVEYRLETTD